MSGPNNIVQQDVLDENILDTPVNTDYDIQPEDYDIVLGEVVQGANFFVECDEGKFNESEMHISNELTNIGENTTPNCLG